MRKFNPGNPGYFFSAISNKNDLRLITASNIDTIGSGVAAAERKVFFNYYHPNQTTGTLPFGGSRDGFVTTYVYNRSGQNDWAVQTAYDGEAIWHATRVLQNGTWSDWYTGNDVHYGYFEINFSSGDTSKTKSVTTNYQIGYWLFLVNSSANVDSNNSLLLDLNTSTGFTVVCWPTTRGTMWAGGGHTSWGLLRADSNTNSITFGAYNYAGKTFTQRNAFIAIKMWSPTYYSS